MADMNQEYLGHEGTTDVITFSYLDDGVDTVPIEGDSEPAGEIFVCPQVALEAANTFKQTLDEELVLYMVHGMLHLDGLDDHTDEDRQTMRSAEAKVMASIREDLDQDVLFTVAQP